jgi:hypothetical protein
MSYVTRFVFCLLLATFDVMGEGGAVVSTDWGVETIVLTLLVGRVAARTWAGEWNRCWQLPR